MYLPAPLHMFPVLQMIQSLQSIQFLQAVAGLLFRPVIPTAIPARLDERLRYLGNIIVIRFALLHHFDHFACIFNHLGGDKRFHTPCLYLQVIAPFPIALCISPPSGSCIRLLGLWIHMFQLPCLPNPPLFVTCRIAFLFIIPARLWVESECDFLFLQFDGQLVKRIFQLSLLRFLCLSFLHSLQNVRRKIVSRFKKRTINFRRVFSCMKADMLSNFPPRTTSLAWIELDRVSAIFFTSTPSIAFLTSAKLSSCAARINARAMFLPNVPNIIDSASFRRSGGKCSKFILCSSCPSSVLVTTTCLLHQTMTFCRKLYRPLPCRILVRPLSP